MSTCQCSSAPLSSTKASCWLSACTLARCGLLCTLLSAHLATATPQIVDVVFGVNCNSTINMKWQPRRCPLLPASPGTHLCSFIESTW